MKIVEKENTNMEAKVSNTTKNHVEKDESLDFVVFKITFKLFSKFLTNL